MSNAIKTLLGIVGIVFLFTMYGVSKYNALATANNEIEAQWANVDTVLQKRFDSIEQAIGGLKIANKSEQDAIQKITDARKIYVAASGNNEAQIAAANNYGGALNGLLLSRSTIGEAYPNLKTPELVGGLISGVSIEGNENRLSVERMRYNEKVKEYNLNLVRFPSNVIASAFGFAKKSFFEITNAEAKNAPKIGEELKF